MKVKVEQHKGDDKRQNSELYEDYFYHQIKLEEEIYVMLNPGNFRSYTYYEKLGLTAIPLIGDYGMLHGRKSQFEALKELLKAEVAHPYYTSIVTHAPCYKIMARPAAGYSLIKERLKYRGKGVYIGLITTDDVDYTSDALRTEGGLSRIACIWHQQKAAAGRYYLNEEINEALKSETPGRYIKLPEKDSISTMMLAIAGGLSKTNAYKGIATEAEFVVAKVNKAPDTLQRIYGGVPNPHAAAMPDVLVALLRLMEFAKKHHKPLVLCIPFNSNVDPHDGSLIPHQMLSLIAGCYGITVITPAGEEADKMHHYGIEGNGHFSNTVNIQVRKANQNVVGVIYTKFANVYKTILHSPAAITMQPIDLEKPGVTHVRETTIYSNGDKISFLNGASRILFRLENPSVGEWTIEFASQTEGPSQINIWISQQEINPYVTLQPSNPLMTIGSLSAANNVMSVGAYDKESMIVLRGSGRGYSWDNRIKTLFVTHAHSVMAPCSLMEWAQVSGTLPAASVMLGAAATFYSKFLEDQVFPLPNTLIMNSILLSSLRQFNGVIYPNPSQGYGIFDLGDLQELLAAHYLI